MQANFYWFFKLSTSNKAELESEAQTKLSG